MNEENGRDKLSVPFLLFFRQILNHNENLIKKKKTRNKYGKEKPYKQKRYDKENYIREELKRRDIEMMGRDDNDGKV